MKPKVAPERALARLLCEKASREASGILAATRGKLRRLFCLEKGRLVYAASNVIEEQFPEYLVRNGLLSPSERAGLVEEAARTGRKFSEALLSSPTTSPETPRRGMEGLIEELLASTLEWPDGDARFEDGLPQLDGEVTVRLPVLPLVLRHARRHPPALDALRVRIGPPDLRPVVTPDADALKGGVEIDATAQYLVASCDGQADLGALVARSPATEEATLRAVYGLLLAGILAPVDRRRQAGLGATRHDAPLTREECVARLQVAETADHYGVLGVERHAAASRIRDAYYALARRYHPDRFRSGELQDLLRRFEEFFTRVTEAYNTLSDAERRREYDESVLAGGEAGPKQTEPAYVARQNFVRARALVQMRKWNDAVTFLENAVQLDGNQPEYSLELGLLLVRNPRRRSDAERHLLRAAELAPMNVAPYLALAQMYARAGRNGPAARALREILRWEPDHAEAVGMLRELGSVQDEPSAGSPLRAIFRS